MDPRGKLIATADNMGRVILFDIKMNCAIRMWKGVRDARLAWTEISYEEQIIRTTNIDGKLKRPCSVSLVIYAPQVYITYTCNICTTYIQ